MKEINLGAHLKESRKLSNMERYHTRFELRPNTVASHSWFVAKIATHLCTIEKDILGNELNEAEVLYMAINHDITEPYTGDIPSPVKRSSEDIKHLLEELEVQVTKNYITPMLPKEERSRFIKMAKDMKNLNTLESRIVKAADILDRVFECYEEIELGNTQEFEEILKEDLELLRDFNLKSVDILLLELDKSLNLKKFLSEEYLQRLEKLEK